MKTGCQASLLDPTVWDPLTPWLES